MSILKKAMNLAAANNEEPTGNVVHLGTATLDNLAASIRNADAQVRLSIESAYKWLGVKREAQNRMCSELHAMGLDITAEPDPVTMRELLAKLAEVTQTPAQQG